MKKKVFIDIKMTIEPEGGLFNFFCKTPEDEIKVAKRWAKDFEEFVRDHRSQDSVKIEVVENYEDQCSNCGSPWETEANGEPVCCTEAIDNYLKEMEKVCETSKPKTI